MRILRNLSLIIIALIIFSCKSYNLKGKTFFAENLEKKVTLDFLNDTLVVVKQEFFCDKLPKKYQEIIFKAKYEIDKINVNSYNKHFKPKKYKLDALIVNNLDCIDCHNYIEVPNYEELGCSNTKYDLMLQDKVELGVIYYLMNDTITLIDNQIFFANLKLKSK